MNSKTIGLMSLLTLVTACGGGGGNSILVNVPEDSGNPDTSGENTLNIYLSADNPLLDVYVVKPEGTYASALYGCALVESASQLCTLDTLPLLGMEVENPTPDDIMTRVLVSHDWMAERFEALLKAYPEEMLPLFRGLTAIVIDADIRPAHYRSETGAIYLDPAYLWTSVEEKITINKQEDYRSGYSDPLSLRAWGRYLKNGYYAYSFGSLDDSSTRSFSDVQIINARLLLHELAHVNDFLPPSSYDSLTGSHTVPQAIVNLSDGRLSDRLQQQAPLTSQLLMGLGQVMYRGATPTETQKAVSAAEAGAEFEVDGAADNYAYSSQFEDLAMLFEVVMMKYFWDIDYEVAYVTPINSGIYCNDYLIGWGRLNWIGETDVKDRAMFVTNELMPHLNMDQFYQDLEVPTLSASNWCLSAPPGSGSQKPGGDNLIINPADFERRVD